MSQESAAIVARPASCWRAAMPWLVGVGYYLLLLALAGRLLGDPDIYWHIQVAEWIAQHGRLPHANPFPGAFAGAPWIAKEWLSQLILAAAYKLASWNGVAVLTAAAVAAAFAGLTRFLLEKLEPLAAFILVLAAIMLSAPHVVARPHALALPIMLLWTAGLVQALDHRRTPSWLLLPLMTVWANLHGGFTFGLLLIGPCILEALLVAERRDRAAVTWQWGRFAIAAVLAACITPYGPESILVTQRIFGLGDALALISEWQPQDFTRLGMFEMCLLGAIGFSLHRGLTLPPIRILVVLGLLHMALTHVRNGELLALLAPLFIAKPLGDQLRSDRALDGESLSRAFIAGCGVLVVAATASVLSLRELAPASRITPSAAVAVLARAPAGPVLNDYAFGGYLIHAGVAPFIDGRTELYGGAFVLRHHRAVALEDLPDFLHLLDEYKIGATLFPPERAAVALLDRLPGWHRLHSDDIAVVHVRSPVQR